MKHYLKVFAAAVCFGIVLAVLKEKLDIDSALFWQWYLAAAAVIIVGATVFNILYARRYGKKMQELVPLLENGQPAAYLAGLEELVETVKTRGLRDMLRLNLSAGYCELDRYEEAITVLESLKFRGSRVPETVRRINLCVCLFHTGRISEAMELYRESEKWFTPCRGKDPYGGNIAVLDIHTAMAEGRYGEARAMLDHAGKAWDTPRLRKYYGQLEQLMRDNEL
ncbi:MAG: hypothetical protein K2N78_08770 [Oscillospiraceae bacterium]|nr:hypothetical protein [Oscillospiraceae bacterium]